MVAIGSTPFVYYRQMVQDNLDNERSYDQMPNFTAADVLRLTGIGRNEYIELLNQSRSKKSISMVTGLFRRTSTENKIILPKKMPSKDFQEVTLLLFLLLLLLQLLWESYMKETFKFDI